MNAATASAAAMCRMHTRYFTHQALRGQAAMLPRVVDMAAIR